MAILKNNTQANFTIISNSILRDKNLSIKDRGMLCTLIGLPNDWEFSIEGLAKILPDGYQAINSSIKRLEELGYLTRTKQRRSDGRFESIIEINPVGTKLDHHGKSAMDNPRREVHDGEPVTDNQKQSNNIYTKNNSKNKNIKSIYHSSGNDRLIDPIFLESTKKQTKYQRLKENLNEDEMKYADRMLLIIAYKKSNPKGNNDLKISGRYVQSGEIMAHILNYRYEEVYAVAKNMAVSDIPVDKPDSYYLTALDKQLKINSPEIYNRIESNAS